MLPRTVRNTNLHTQLTGRTPGAVVYQVAVLGPVSPLSCTFSSRLDGPTSEDRSLLTSKYVAAQLLDVPLMVHQFTRWLRDIPVDFDTTLSLLAGEWTVT